jgi:hypothetical protein
VSRLSRIRLFVWEMFPPWMMVPFGVAKFYAVYLTMQALAGVSQLTVTPRSIAGALTIVALLLLTRVFDEIKDSEADKVLAAAGDPRYMGRPLVRGAVLISDVVALRGVLIVGTWILQLAFFDLYMLAGFGFAYGLLWCSSKWFFCPAISKSLLLAFVTHNPLTLVLLVYAASVFYADFGPTRVPGLVALMLALWMPLAAWETSRKIRIPEDETAYQTYTKVVGSRSAAVLPILFVIIATLSSVFVARAVGLSWVFPTVLTLAALIPIAGCLRFMLAPSRQAAKLQPLTELFGLVVDVGLPLSVVFS